ncbi:NADPH-dependent FMN reductase [Planomonospora sp. ID82291]|uniref:NADPH-dependent FMN reductase n=1 Tax=Planomonospora sp. ID82291 TaxID=2738136 RepID=UPI0018C39720|nr:NADPH-dependent FMN reductase [Planomonospora sp. ID82291]MBG0818826.1 NAD(P)H-dependent oxidoreductase [Planomonospora sp. ID82291]
MRIVGIAGSLRPAAHVGRLLEAVARELPVSADFTVWEGLAEIPPFTGGPLPSPAEEFCDLLSGADGLLITAPEHSVLPVQLLHALEWASRPGAGAVLLGKPAAVVTACVRPHEAMWAQTALRRPLVLAGAVVYGVDLPASPAPGRFDAAGGLADPAVRDRLGGVVEVLCARARSHPREAVPGKLPEGAPGKALETLPGGVPGRISLDRVSGTAPVALQGKAQAAVPVMIPEKAAERIPV